MSAFLAREYGGWIVAAAAVALTVALAFGSAALLRRPDPGPGLTTEVAILVMFVTGCLVGSNQITAAIVVTGCVTVLLAWKKPMHRFVDHMGEADVRAVIRLALIGLVILPAMPDRTIGPYRVLNPFEIWLMVVLIVGISLAAYVAYRVFGARRGSLLGGVLGGLISSTATTVTYARRSRENPAESHAAALVVVVSSGVVFLRVLLEIGVVIPGQWLSVAPPLLAMAGVFVIAGFVAYVRTPSGPPAPDREPPSELKAAVVFGLLYAAVLLAVAFARRELGTTALYGVAALSGLTDMDAITLSTSQLIRAGRLEVETGWRLILVGSMANLAFKAAVVAALGDRKLRASIVAYFAAPVAAGASILALWPS